MNIVYCQNQKANRDEEIRNGLKLPKMEKMGFQNEFISQGNGDFLSISLSKLVL